MLFLDSRFCKYWLETIRLPYHETDACCRQTSLQLPSEIQARIAHSIDSDVGNRVILAIENKLDTLLDIQKASCNLIEGTSQNLGARFEKNHQDLALDLANKFDILSLSDKALLEAVQYHGLESRIASQTVRGMISELSTRQSQSTDMVLRRVRETSNKTGYLIDRNNSILREQASSLHQKLDRMSWLTDTVKEQQPAQRNISSPELQNAVGNIKQIVWLLVSVLHILIRELV